MLVYLVALWYILWPFGIIYGRLVQLLAVWYIFPVLVGLDQEKSGNPADRSIFWIDRFISIGRKKSFFSTDSAKVSDANSLTVNDDNKVLSSLREAERDSFPLKQLSR
jgi:hypothetical protein